MHPTGFDVEAERAYRQRLEALEVDVEAAMRHLEKLERRAERPQDDNTKPPKARDTRHVGPTGTGQGCRPRPQAADRGDVACYFLPGEIELHSLF